MKRIGFIAFLVLFILFSHEARASSKFGDSLPVSRALAAKMLAFIGNDKSSIDGYERILSYSDTKASDWFDRYLNACVHENLMLGSGDNFKPNDNLTLEQAQMLLSSIDKKNTITLDINNQNRTKAISYALWVELYLSALKNASGEKDLYEAYGFIKEEHIILASHDNNKKLPVWNAISHNGALTHFGIDLSGCIDKSIEALVKDGEIIAIISVNETPTITNCYIVSKTADKITVFCGGAERTFSYFQNLGSERICDITFKGSEALFINPYKDELTGTVKRLDGAKLELDSGDSYEVAHDFRVFSLVDVAVKWKRASSILNGTSGTTFILKEGKICAAIINKIDEIKNIRVLISSTGFNGYMHDNISISSDKPFFTETMGSARSFEAGEVFTLTTTPLTNDGSARTLITPSEGGKLQLLSVKRAWEKDESPWYRGTIEINEGTGGFCIVNELPLEEYLYAVVPSEMPTAHGLEAAKVQAVSARSFAYNQYYQNSYYQYGANVDDSVLCQVYNNIPENENSINAVKQTAGQCLVYNGEVISANYFSTSAGITANAGEVWAGASGRQFPAQTQSFLSARTQLLGGSFPDLRSNENADSFFRTSDLESYDSGFSWYRWNVSMSVSELTESINRNLGERYAASPSLIKTKQENGVFKSAPISSIGTLTDIEVRARGAGGNIMELVLVGTKETILVQTEYNIRNLLKPFQQDKEKPPIKLTLADGSVIENYSLMPSAFFTFDKEQKDGQLSFVHFFGGGMGHGVGMSQNGVKGMIDEGLTFVEILKHYYQGTDVVKVIN